MYRCFYIHIEEYAGSGGDPCIINPNGKVGRIMVPFLDSLTFNIRGSNRMKTERGTTILTTPNPKPETLFACGL